MRRGLIGCGLAFLWATPLWAVPHVIDDFENGVGGKYTYAPWGNNPGDPTSPNGINNLVTTDTAHNHTPAGSKSARVFASDPAAWNGYVDFGATAGDVHAEVYIYEDFSNNGTNSSQPVTNMLSLYGDAANPNAFTDYLQLGVVPFYPAGSTGYGWRTNSNGIFNTSPATARAQGWTKLAIDAYSLASGGQVKFYINDNLVGTGSRTAGVSLRYVRIGNNSKSYENFWYDDLSVTPEPAALALLGVGALCLRRRRHIA